MDDRQSIPKGLRENVRRATTILKRLGCTDVYLFGSIAAANADDGSDIDLAVRGCPKGGFFQALGKLMLELDYPVDLVSLDADDPFARYLETEGELLKVG